MRTHTRRSACLARTPLATRLTTMAWLTKMVWLTRMAWLIGVVAVIAVTTGYGALASRAHADMVSPGPTLADAWLETLPQLTEPVSWSHAYGLLANDQQRLEQERRYLVEELTTLLISAQVAGNTAYSQTLTAWRDALRSWEGQPLRSPERLDLPKLGANLRNAPLLSRVVHWGACEIPAWVEVWGLAGVTRVKWQPNMHIDTLTEHLIPQAFTSVDYVRLITPQGQVLHRGIAAWNHEETPLAPGSRMIVELPNRQGLTGALPLPGTTHELDIINQRLPGVLAAQLPGDQCTQWQAP